VIHRSGYERTGEVIRLLGDLETEGRMARILAAVQDPLGFRDTGEIDRPLLIGEYVRVEIAGPLMTRVFRIPRIALRENDTIWVVGDDSTLDIRSVRTIWRNKQAVFLKEGLNPGEQLIVSDLAAPVAGMKIQAEDTDTVEPDQSA
jgi:hypothetical protein